MPESVYLETTIISYLAAHPSSELVIAACQEMTREWWQNCSHSFDLYVSERVIAEARAGDRDAAARRIKLMQEIPVLTVSAEASKLAQILYKHLELPERAIEDALHISLAIVSGMNYLLTWNCKHIANARIISRIAEIAAMNGYVQHPVICTPQELLEDYR